MDLPGLLDSYGYWAVLIGTFLEGETILVLGGFAAYEGYLSLQFVALSAFAGSLCGDQLYFFVGRHFGRKLLHRRPVWRVRSQSVNRLIERYHSLFILGFRFVYGIRTVAPFAIGMTDVPTRRFIVLNVAGAAIWAWGIGTLGYLCGHVVALFLDKVKRYEKTVFLVLLLAGLTLWLIRSIQGRRRARNLDAAADPDRTVG